MVDEKADRSLRSEAAVNSASESSAMAMHTGGRLFGPHRDQLRLLKPIYLPSGLQIPAAGLQRGPTVSLLAKRTHAGHANCDHDHHGHHHHHAHRHHDRMSGAGTPKGAEAVPELAKSAPAGSSAAPPADAGAAPELTVQGAFKYASDLVR